MTTICVAKIDEHVVYGCDNATSIGSERVHTVASNKKYIINNKNFFGITGSPTFLLAVYTYLSEVESISLTDRFDVYRFLVGLHSNLKEYHFLDGSVDENSNFESIGLTMLIANAHGIFSTYDNREVIYHSDYYAIGSGQEYALGAMSLAARSTNDARTLVESGLYSASVHDLYTDQNWDIENL